MRLPRWTPGPTNSQRPEKRLVSSLWGELSQAILKLFLNPHEQAAGRLGRRSFSVGPRPGRHPRTGADRIPRPEGRDQESTAPPFGSRAQKGGAVDSWSDYDYQLITTRPERYGDGSFCRALGPCWAVGAHEAFGNCVKVTAVYEGA